MTADREPQTEWTLQTATWQARGHTSAEHDAYEVGYRQARADAAREAQPDPRVEALIAALTNAGRDLHWYHTGDVAFEACGSFTCTAIGHALENAKRRAPAAPPAGIDVRPTADPEP